MAGLSPFAVAAALICALATVTPTDALANLPETPVDGMELSYSVTCDFEKYFWSVSLIYSGHTTANIRRQTRRTPFSQEVNRVHNLHPDLARSLYNLTRTLFRDYRIGEGVDAEVDSPRIDERTFEARVLVIQPRAGRLDEISLAIDLTPGRQLPALLDAIMAALGDLDRSLVLDIRCR